MGLRTSKEFRLERAVTMSAATSSGVDNHGYELEDVTAGVENDERDTDIQAVSLELEPMDAVAAPRPSSVKEANVAEEAAAAPGPGGVDAVTAPKHNMYQAARGHVQRVVDVALLMNNMSQLATVFKRSDDYSDLQFAVLVATLVLSMAFQIVAGVCFFIIHERELDGDVDKSWYDYAAYAAVGAVMVLNIFTTTFGASWTDGNSQ